VLIFEELLAALYCQFGPEQLPRKLMGISGELGD
jgi:hypothetical protein